MCEAKLDFSKMQRLPHPHAVVSSPTQFTSCPIQKEAPADLTSESLKAFEEIRAVFGLASHPGHEAWCWAVYFVFRGQKSCFQMGVSQSATLKMKLHQSCVFWAWGFEQEEQAGSHLLVPPLLLHRVYFLMNGEILTELRVLWERVVWP